MNNLAVGLLTVKLYVKPGIEFFKYLYTIIFSCINCPMNYVKKTFHPYVLVISIYFVEIC